MPPACIDCQIEFGPKFKFINCNFCENSFCLKCSKLKQSLFNDIGKEASVHWHCSHCRIAMPAVNKIVTKLADIESRVEKLEKETPRSDRDQIKGVFKEIQEEEKEREEKKLNIVVHQLKESEDDLEGLKDILNTLGLGVEVENVTRLGKSNNGRDRPRPLRFTVGTFDTKRTILMKSSGLKNHEKYSSVFLTPDLTRNQRREAFELRQTKRKREQEGERNLAIRKGRIVKLPDRRSDHSYSGGSQDRNSLSFQAGGGGGSRK